MKTIKINARDFGIDDVADFFSVDPKQETESDKKYVCEVS